ncbi:MAG: histidine--tRNA ligase, partial [Prevotella sp.]|nr:histidine--tRNA ligase [Prevotella sp.]
PKDTTAGARLLFLNFGEEELKCAMSLAAEARQNGIATEVYSESVKLKKQMTYANNRNIRFVAIIGENELSQNKVMLKDMHTGEQSLIPQEELIQMVKKEI